MPAAFAALAIGAVLVTSPDTRAGDLRSQRPMSGLPAAGTTTKVGNRATEPKRYVPPRPTGLRSGDQIDFVYDGRTSSYSFGQLITINRSGWNSGTTSGRIVHDHRGKTASKPPGTPPGAPPAAPPAPLSGPPAAPPETIFAPPASGNVVRTHEKDFDRITTYKVKDHREGYGGDKYETKRFRTSTGETFAVTPRQKPPCFGDACWFFGR
jgi:hypothetical protein